MKLFLHPAHVYYLACEANELGIEGLSVNGVEVTRDNEMQIALMCTDMISQDRIGTKPIGARFTFEGPDDHLMWIVLKANEVT